MKFLGINVLIAFIVVVVILVVVIIGLRKYTKHGQEIEVPQITGLYQTEAEVLLSSSGLRLEVVDSTFSNKVPLGTIVEQIPPAESHAKEGRTIYVVVNASAQRQVVLPELHDVSYRQATNMLHQLGLTVDSMIYEPSEYRDLILDLRKGEESLETGTKVPEGTAITLVVGQGRGTEMVTIPELGGLNVVGARSLLLAEHLTMGQVEYDEEVTEENKEKFVVYMQTPQSGSLLLEGSTVQIKLSTNRERAITEDNIENEDVFF
ncbi:MAG: PASTA domain-containing protein [Paludibacteraceae bacterium]|nr:PASTA domain-containing protein [Paludibacteraceae bacterium]